MTFMDQIGWFGGRDGNNKLYNTGLSTYVMGILAFNHHFHRHTHHHLNSCWQSKQYSHALVKAMVFPVVVYRCERWTIRRLSSKELMHLTFAAREDS